MIGLTNALTLSGNLHVHVVIRSHTHARLGGNDNAGFDPVRPWQASCGACCPATIKMDVSDNQDG
jgi:hypothetical protein